jgi:hypothetical protein
MAELQSIERDSFFMDGQALHLRDCIEVEMSVVLISLTDIDCKTQCFSADFMVMMEFKNPYLREMFDELCEEYMAKLAKEERGDETIKEHTTNTKHNRSANLKKHKVKLCNVV